jgi:hypothetical protein
LKLPLVPAGTAYLSPAPRRWGSAKRQVSPGAGYRRRDGTNPATSLPDPYNLACGARSLPPSSDRSARITSSTCASNFCVPSHDMGLATKEGRTCHADQYLEPGDDRAARTGLAANAERRGTDFETASARAGAGPARTANHGATTRQCFPERWGRRAGQRVALVRSAAGRRVASYLPAVGKNVGPMPSARATNKTLGFTDPVPLSGTAEESPAIHRWESEKRKPIPFCRRLARGAPKRTERLLSPRTTQPCGLSVVANC